MPDREKRSGSQDAKVQTIRGRPANLTCVMLVNGPVDLAQALNVANTSLSLSPSTVFVKSCMSHESKSQWIHLSDSTWPPKLALEWPRFPLAASGRNSGISTGQLRVITF